MVGEKPVGSEVREDPPQGDPTATSSDVQGTGGQVVALYIRCAHCGKTSRLRVSALVVVVALTEWNQMALQCECRTDSYSASPSQLQSIREQLGPRWIEEHRRIKEWAEGMGFSEWTLGQRAADGRTMMARAMRNKNVVVPDDPRSAGNVASDLTNATLRARAIVSLIVNDKPTDVLILQTAHADFFDSEGLKLLAEGWPLKVKLAY